MTHTEPHTGPSAVTGAPPLNAIKHPKCGRWWTGLGRAHCPACCRTFSCDSAADKHRTGRYGKDRRCVDPATTGLVATAKPWGEMWQNPAPESVAAVTPAQWARGTGSQAA
ncbi:hypothetical protein ACFQ2B_27705 [Streptomyces stramineus]|uniref:Phage FDXHR zinc binding domain-containing protein n=1 Tax=Streptomyces stramineus TaxID=173861 RepID=A0ABN0ZP34_9ACTN